MLTVDDVDRFLNVPKNSVSAMDWRPGLSKKDVQWWSWDCAIEVDGVIPEGARVVLQWRPVVGAAHEKYSCGLLLRNERVFAVDFDPNGQHTNKVGHGKPYFGKRFGPGTHIHTWSTEGKGYAEPIDNFQSLSQLFEFFCTRAKLNVLNGFRQPPSQQLLLGLI